MVIKAIGKEKMSKCSGYKLLSKKVFCKFYLTPKIFTNYLGTVERCCSGHFIN